MPTDDSWANPISDAFRRFFAMIDRGVYGLLAIMYEIFFNVASAELFSNATIKHFYSRVQLIIGVFMVFRLAIALLTYIVDPDKFLDNKEGIGSIITKIVVSLGLLVAITPINIPNAQPGTYNARLNNDGLLFGTLFSLQDRILNNNTIGKLVLGTSDTSTTATTNSLQGTGNMFATSILKTFFRINLKPEAKRTKHVDGKDDEVFNENRICEDIDPAHIQVYTSLNSAPGDLLNLVDKQCKYGGKDARYNFWYGIFLTTIMGGLFTFIIISYTVEIAMRVIKLAILRLIAPIPIIAHMGPTSKEDMLSTWFKTLMTTYADLFIRLALMFFVLFIVQDMIQNGIIINNGSGMIGVISAVFIWIGLFFFAKQAPKFIKQALGIKDESSFGLFSGLGKLAGVGALATGAIGAAVTGVKSNLASRDERGRHGVVGNIGSGLLGGITGMATGIGTGAKSLLDAKEGEEAKGVKSSIRNMNAARMAFGQQGGTWLGKTADRFGLSFTGRARADKDEALIARNKKITDLYDKIKTKADVDKTPVSYSYSDRTGTYGASGNVKDLKEEFERLKLTGASSDQLYTAEQKYKAAQAEVIRTRVASANSSDLIYQYQQQIVTLANNDKRIINDSTTGTPLDMKTSDGLKSASFNAADQSDELQFGSKSGKYNARKADAEAAKESKNK